MEAHCNQNLWDAVETKMKACSNKHLHGREKAFDFVPQGNIF